MRLSEEQKAALDAADPQAMPPGAVKQGIQAISRLMIAALDPLRAAVAEANASGSDVDRQYAAAEVPRYAYSIDELRDLPGHDDEWLLAMRRVDGDRRVVMTMRGAFSARDCADLVTMVALLQVLDRSKMASVDMPGESADPVVARASEVLDEAEGETTTKLVARSDLMIEAATLCGRLIRDSQAIVLGAEVAALDRLTSRNSQSQEVSDEAARS